MQSHDCLRRQSPAQLQHDWKSGNGHWRNGRCPNRRMRRTRRAKVITLRCGPRRRMGMRPRRGDIDLRSQPKSGIPSPAGRTRKSRPGLRRHAILGWSMEVYPHDPALETRPHAANDWWRRTKKTLGPLAVVGVMIAKFFAKLKFLVLPLLKFLPILLKSGGTRLLMIWVYTAIWGWKFGVGFVLLLLVHECGHLIVAKKFGLKVGAPVFIPFMGAFIALKEAPRNAWIEACVGIGGPILGSLGRCF